MFVRSGLRFENIINNGISHFIEHMLFRGNSVFPNSYLLNRGPCKLLYPDNALARPTIGTEESIRGISLEDLKSHYSQFYTPANMILVVAGCVDHNIFFNCAKEYFSRLIGSSSISTKYFDQSLNEAQIKPEFLFQHDSDSQIQLQLCFRSVSYNHPDYFIATLISRLFDDGVTSRLQKILREEKGLVYSVECRATSLPDTGTIDFDVSVRSEKIIEVTEILLGEINKFILSGVSEDELNLVKQRYGYDLDYELDDPYRQIIRHGFCHLYSNEYSAEDEREKISQITPFDILRVARNIFVPEKLNFVLVGPYTSKLKARLEQLVQNF